MRSPYELAVINRCIYDPSHEGPFSREHIIPESLGGKLWVGAASCASCADKTREFERVVAREMYWPLRLSLGIKGKRNHKKERPTHWPAEIGEGRDWEETQIEVGKLPRVYLAPEFPPAGILRGDTPHNGNPHMSLQLKGNRAAMQAFLQQIGAANLQLQHVFKWAPFCRMLAKASHAYTVGVLGLDGAEFLLPPLILGGSDHLAYLVGGTTEPVTSSQPELALCFRLIGATPFVTARVTLFGGRFPPYEVVSAKVHDVDAFIAKVGSLKSSEEGN